MTITNKDALKIITAFSKTDGVQVFDYVEAVLFENLNKEDTLALMDKGRVIAIDIKSRIVYLGYFADPAVTSRVTTDGKHLAETKTYFEIE